jgi:hypothetical protein
VDEFAEVFKETDDDHDQRSGDSNQKHPGQDDHCGVADCDHMSILNQPLAVLVDGEDFTLISGQEIARRRDRRGQTRANSGVIA